MLLLFNDFKSIGVLVVHFKTTILFLNSDNKYFKIKVDVMNTPYFSVVLLQRFAWQIEIAMVDHARDVKKDLALC